ncbi:MAG: hypothetical protein ACLUE8_10625 [Lachnospiraceae bacterium]
MGADTIEETLLGLTFEIAPLSFFQVNPDQCERLYECAIRLAALRAGATCVVDACRGRGHHRAVHGGRARQSVVGIEIVPQAVERAPAATPPATASPTRSSIVGAVEDGAAAAGRGRGLRPDVVLLDPPRKGRGAARHRRGAARRWPQAAWCTSAAIVPTPGRDVARKTDRAGGQPARKPASRWICSATPAAWKT